MNISTLPRIAASTSILGLIAALGAVGCSPAQAAPTAAYCPQAPAPPPVPAPPPSHGKSPSRADHHVYRFDFALTGVQIAEAPDTSFTLTLEEDYPGEVLVGKNTALASSAPPPLTPAAGSAPGAPPSRPPVAPTMRQDIGVKVRGSFVPAGGAGDDVLFDGDAEISWLEPGGSIRKMTARPRLVVSPGKSAVVLGVDEGQKHSRLTVTATKVR